MLEINKDLSSTPFCFIKALPASKGRLVIGKAEIQTGMGKRDFERTMIERLLGVSLGEPSLRVSHAPSGAPFIVGMPELAISISHSRGYFAIYTSEYGKVGVDIQVFKPHLGLNADYFLNENELLNPEWKTNDSILHQIWGAKEALFKLLKGDVGNIKESITVIAIDEGNLSLEFQGKSFFANSLSLEDSILVYLHD